MAKEKKIKMFASLIWQMLKRGVYLMFRGVSKYLQVSKFVFCYRNLNELNQSIDCVDS